MKKRYFACLLAAVITVMLFVPGCYRTQAAPLKNIVGTYRLEQYEIKSSSEGDVNMLKEQGIECYLVVAQNGNGYYAYKDNSTAPYILNAHITFEASSEDENKFEYVKYVTEMDGFEDKLGYNKNTLSKTIVIWKGSVLDGTLRSDGTQYAEFKKVDKAQDLSYVTKKMTAPVYAFGEYYYNGYFRCNSIDPPAGVTHDEADLYVYNYIKLDSLAHKATAYSMLKSDMQPQTQELAYSVAVAENEFGGLGLKLTIGEQESWADISGQYFLNHNKGFDLTYPYTAYPGEEYETVYDITQEFLRAPDITDETVESVIAARVQEYNEQLQYQK